MAYISTDRVKRDSSPALGVDQAHLMGCSLPLADAQGPGGFRRVSGAAQVLSLTRRSNRELLVQISTDYVSCQVRPDA